MEYYIIFSTKDMHDDELTELAVALTLEINRNTLGGSFKNVAGDM